MFLLGITLPQEYICAAFEDLDNKMKMFLESPDRSLIDVTGNQIMLGYKPLLLGLMPVKNRKGIESGDGDIKILHIGLSENEIIAKLRMKKVYTGFLDSQPIFILEGVRGEHYFTNYLQQRIQNFYYNLTADKVKNIFLEGNLYTQVKIAYSFPRLIYLISIGSNDAFNIFPSDLSGKINSVFFAVSLRTDRKANRQVESSANCLISEMQAAAYKETYLLGQNHVRDLVTTELLNIQLRTERSQKLKLPVPEKAAAYYELERLSKIEFGLHSLHFFKIINYVRLNESNSTLAHIHRDYAGWRIKRKMNAPYLLR